MCGKDGLAHDDHNKKNCIKVHETFVALIVTNRITAIIKGQRGITGDTALRLGTFFNTPPGFWMNLQKTYELRLAEKALPGEIKNTCRKSGKHEF